MSDSVISLAPTMQRRMNFRHDLMDNVDDYKIEAEETSDVVAKFLEGSTGARDKLILGYMWLAKDVVCRYRAHFAETRPMTDDMASVALLALTEFVDNLESDREFFNRCQTFISGRLRGYINDNRSICSASKTTNQRRAKEGLPLEYHFAETLYEDAVGQDDLNPGFVDILDAVERLREVDKEEMHTLIKMFLSQNHNIDEADLTEDELVAIEKLAEIGKSL